MAALDFPAAPVNGQVFTGVGGINWVWDGAKWNPGTSLSAGQFVPLAGGTMTGPLVLSGLPTQPEQAASKAYVDARVPVPLTVPGGGTGLTSLPVTNVGFTPAFTTVLPLGNGTGPLVTATANWTIMGGRFPGAELSLFTAVSGASNQINMFKAEGTLAAPTRTNVNLVLGGISFGGHNGTNWTAPASTIYCKAEENWSAAGNGTKLFFSAVKVGASVPAVAMWLDGDGALSINGNDHARLFLNKSQASSYTSAIYGQKNGVTRWALELGNVAVESTGNVGSDFTIGRFADNGSFIDNPIVITRGGGLITLTSIETTITGGSLRLLVPNTGYAVIERNVNGVRSWTDGVWVDGNWNIYDNTANAFRIGIDSAGTCRNTSGTWVAYSDIALKRDIQPYERGLVDLVKLTPVMFKYNGYGNTVDDDTQQYGLVAQEVQPVVPEIVSTSVWKPTDSEGKLTDEEPVELLSVDPGRLIYAVLNSLREIDTRLKALEGAP